jgi:hypothetical protein
MSEESITTVKTGTRSDTNRAPGPISRTSA